MRYTPCPACDGSGLPDADGFGRCGSCRGSGLVADPYDFADHLDYSAHDVAAVPQYTTLTTRPDSQTAQSEHEG